MAASRLVRRTPSTGVRHERRVEQERRAVQLERFQLVKRLQAAGLSAAAIMRETGIGRKSVLTWIRLRELPRRNRMAATPRDAGVLPRVFVAALDGGVSQCQAADGRDPAARLCRRLRRPGQARRAMAL